MKWNSPYISDGTWLKGNMHTHSTVSDGLYHPREVAQMYLKIGKYDFVVLTDHTGNNHEIEDAEDAFHVPDITVIMGREESGGRHVVGIGCKMVYENIIKKDRNDYTLEDYQLLIDQIRKDGGHAFLPHPHWKYDDYWTSTGMLKLGGYFGLEIINGDRFNGPRNLATDVWDEVLSAGKTIWGLANDDFHGPGEFMNAWNMVKARSKSPEDIIRAITSGSCYASNGAAFESIETDGNCIILQCSEDSIYKQCEKTFRFIGDGGKLLQTQTGKNGTAIYRGIGEEKYVRAEMTLDWGMSAFTQPFYPVFK